MKLSKVTVFGSTGAQGAPVVKLLLEKGVGVRAVSRDAAKTRALHGAAVEAASADLLDLESIKRALDGADAAFFHLPIPRSVADVPRQLANFLEAAHAVRLPRLVFTTSGPTDARLAANPMVAGNLAAADAVLSSGLEAVVLKPTVYLENLLQLQNLAEIVERGTLSYPPLAPGRKISWTGLEDQAALAVAALTAEKAVGRAFAIASPEPVSGDELVALIGREIGREVRFTPATPEAFGASIAEFFGPEAGAAIATLYEETEKLPADGTVVDLDETLAVLPAELTPVSSWIRRQDWSLSPQAGKTSFA